MNQEGHHTKEAGDRKDVQRGRRLFSDIDFLMCNVIEHGQSLGLLAIWLTRGNQRVSLGMKRATYGGNSDPAREKKSRILKSSGESEYTRSYISIAGVYREQADHRSLGRVIDQPAWKLLACCIFFHQTEPSLGVEHDHLPSRH